MSAADMSGAACAGDGEMWFSLDHRDIELAVSICNGCALRTECLEQSLAFEGSSSATGRYGVAGGLTPSQRARLRPRAGILAPCGTPGAGRRHRRNGEDPCPECRAALSVYWRQQKGRAS